MTTALLSRQEVARLFGVSEVTITRWEKTKKLPAPVMIHRKCFRWERSVIEAMLAGNEAPPTGTVAQVG